MRWPFLTVDPGSTWLPAESLDPSKAPPVSHFPLPGWPAQGTVEYLTKLIVLGLLLLALPYLIGSLLTRPSDVLEGRAAAAIASKPPA